MARMGAREFKAELERRLADRLEVAGDTYPNRETLKARGALWDRVERVWLAPDVATWIELITLCCTEDGRARVLANWLELRPRHQDAALVRAALGGGEPVQECVCGSAKGTVRFDGDDWVCDRCAAGAVAA